MMQIKRRAQNMDTKKPFISLGMSISKKIVSRLFFAYHLRWRKCVMAINSVLLVKNGHALEQLRKDPKTERTIALKNGLRIICNYKDMSCIADVFLLNEYLPSHAYAIRKGDIVLDIGANIGTFALQAAWQGATVYAFEPCARNYKMLCRNIAVNELQKKIIPFNIGIDIKRGTAILHQHPDLPGSGSLLKSTQGHANSIKVDTLPNILKRLKIKRVQFLKIDIEGGEYRLFKHWGKPVYERIDKIVGEYHTFPDADRKDHTFDELRKILKAHFDIVQHFSLTCFHARKRHVKRTKA